MSYGASIASATVRTDNRARLLHATRRAARYFHSQMRERVESLTPYEPTASVHGLAKHGLQQLERLDDAAWSPALRRITLLTV